MNRGAGLLGQVVDYACDIQRKFDLTVHSVQKTTFVLLIIS